MSRAQQKKFLVHLHKELSRNSEKDVYRKMTADRRMHTFTVTRRALRRGIKDRLESNFIGISPNTVSLILKKSDKYVKALIKEVGGAIQALAKKNPDDITVLKFTASRIESAFTATGQSRFDQIKRTYNTRYQVTAAGITLAMREVLGAENEELEASSMWQLEHNHLKGIAESQIKDAVDNALLEEEVITRAAAMSFFKGMGVELEIIRKGSTGVMEVFLGSQRANSREGGISGARKQKLQKVLRDALLKLQQTDSVLVNLGGSDSFKESKVKKTRRAVLDPFKKVKIVKVKSKNIKAKDSNTSAKKATTQKTIVEKNPMKAKAIAAARRKKAKASPAGSMLQMIGMINKELPDTVRKNMNSPALVNRTGRFAESTKVTDIAQTPKGLPSIGYTYQRDPYQVFEDGSSGAWSNGRRDPRKLIDSSIREIAVKMAIGRFYTRRV